MPGIQLSHEQERLNRGVLPIFIPVFQWEILGVSGLTTTPVSSTTPQNGQLPRTATAPSTLGVRCCCLCMEISMTVDFHPHQTERDSLVSRMVMTVSRPHIRIPSFGCFFGVVVGERDDDLFLVLIDNLQSFN